MIITAYEVRGDEQADFEYWGEKLGLTIRYYKEPLSLENLSTAEGSDAITILGHSHMDQKLLDGIKEKGIFFLATRTIGYNHIDLEYAKKIGVRISNSHYAPNGVAEYTIMLILMSLRHYKQALYRGNVNDYSLRGLQGRELRNLTVGIVGTGKIGYQVIENLQGFGCRILAYDTFQRSDMGKKAEYVNLETLYRECDIISLHTPLLDSTYHMIDKRALEKMKDGVVLVNCARGELMNIPDIIEGVESEKIGALGLDVFEKEDGIYHEDRRCDIISNRDMAYLRQFRNVTMTQHMAFYTDAAVSSMVEGAILSLDSFYRTGSSSYEL